MDEQPLGSGSAERELSELREREASYRDRLSNVATLTRTLREHTTAILEFLRRSPPRRKDLMRTLSEVARISREALGVSRVSIWMFDAEGHLLTCMLQLNGDGEHAPESSLTVSSAPAYFRAIRTSGVVAVENALEDLRTEGLEPYLRENGVAALLDISVAIPGGLLGVVCHEHVGGVRSWQPEEIDFATHVGNLVALALVTERRAEAEARMVSVEARYRYLVESLPVSVYSFDAFSNKLEYLSPQFGEFGAFEPEEVLSRGVSAWLDIIHPEDRRLVEARFAPHGIDTVPTEVVYRLMLPTGGMRYVRDSCRVVRNHAGEPVAIQGVLADVTEQRLSEQRAVELERRLRTLLEHVDLIGLVLDRSGRIEFVNSCFERSTGYFSRDVVGVDGFALLLAPEESNSTRANFLRDLGQGHVAERFENEILTRTGERRHVVWTNTILRADDGTPEGSCSLGLDVTERVRLEAQLMQQTKLESLGQLSAGVAHDFNNLLTVLTYGTEVLSRSRSGGAASETIVLMQKALEQASELTRSLLVYARRDDVSPRAVSVDRLIEDAVPLLGAISGKGVVGTALHAEGVRVVIDPAQLRQVILNLVGNAVDAIRGHGTRVTVRTSLEYVDDTRAREHGAAYGGSFLHVAVEDDGPGMDRRTLSRIFEPFFTTKEQGKGTGLGLSMCQSIVRRARGFITVESEVRAGTTCHVYLPVAVSADVLNDSAPPTLVSPAPTSRPRALVVEDEPVVRNQLVSGLEALSVDVRAVGTVAEARRILASEPLDLLITDGSLTDGLGRILARSARVARPSLRVLLVSGSLETGDVFDAVLTKPFSAEELRLAVASLLPKPAS